MLTGISHTGDFKFFLAEQQYSPTCLSFTAIESESKSSRSFHSCCSCDAANIPNCRRKTHTLHYHLVINAVSHHSLDIPL